MIKHRLLVPLLLSPWLLAVWIGALNLQQPRPRRLQVLVWSVPALPVGAWLLLGSSLGTALSATTVGLLLKPGSRPGPRQVRNQRTGGFPRNEAVEPEPGEADRGSRRVSDQPPFDHGEAGQDDFPPWGPPPVRNVDEPAPTMDVPFRVVRFGGAAPARPTGGQAHVASEPERGPAADDSDWDQPDRGQW